MLQAPVSHQEHFITFLHFHFDFLLVIFQDNLFAQSKNSKRTLLHFSEQENGIAICHLMGNFYDLNIGKIGGKLSVNLND